MWIKHGSDIVVQKQDDAQFRGGSSRNVTKRRCILYEKEHHSSFCRICSPFALCSYKCVSTDVQHAVNGVKLWNVNVDWVPSDDDGAVHERSDVGVLSCGCVSRSHVSSNSVPDCVSNYDRVSGDRLGG